MYGSITNGGVYLASDRGNICNIIIIVRTIIYDGYHFNYKFRVRQLLRVRISAIYFFAVPDPGPIPCSRFYACHRFTCILRLCIYSRRHHHPAAVTLPMYYTVHSFRLYMLRVEPRVAVCLASYWPRGSSTSLSLFCMLYKCQRSGINC